MRELHLYEKPLALQTAQAANLNRDQKKRRQPFVMDDFYLYQPKDELNLPAERYGAAAVALAEAGLFPSFALFCFPELRKNANDTLPPTLVAFVGDGAVLLAPTAGDNTIHGLLIAEHAVSSQLVDMKSPCGQTITAQMPIIKDEVMAEEDVTLPLY